MAYAVDFVLNVMKELSSSEPVLFQRDGSLYIVSAEGFGQVTYGLRTAPEKIESWEKRKQSPEILQSEDVIKKRIGDKPSYKKGEERYLKEIVFGSDTQSFTLEEITEAAQELSKLPDDGKIRMVGHHSSYHSHKYGYAADGIDVWVQEARVMNKKSYLKLLRKEEEGILQGMESLNKIEEKNNLGRAYDRLRFPDCLILTPHMMINLPRGGSVHSYRDKPDSWNKKTQLSYELYHNDVNTYRESPFAVQIKVNAQNLKAGDSEKLTVVKDEFLEQINKGFNAINSNMKTAEDFLVRINGIHNEVAAQNIEWRKDLRRSVSARAAAP